jgi:hypothetical protein
MGNNHLSDMYDIPLGMTVGGLCCIPVVALMFVMESQRFAGLRAQVRATFHR